MRAADFSPLYMNIPNILEYYLDRFSMMVYIP